ncbi:hypothetical protein [Hyphococcus luteus]|uniref:Uncharacterized protein n=1 Tax=Hyphococcus luteus TaxID=2058213 RepID=A0A2S7K4D7_9PROT|nr:hypothetical protein [Marinicaulis flavus]PQA87370.1 hypothetical protein CW354_12190 [Marinicaulis flavus]
MFRKIQRCSLQRVPISAPPRYSPDGYLAAAAGYNFKRIAAWLKAFLRRILAAVLGVIAALINLVRSVLAPNYMRTT